MKYFVFKKKSVFLEASQKFSDYMKMAGSLRGF